MGAKPSCSLPFVRGCPCASASFTDEHAVVVDVVADGVLPRASSAQETERDLAESSERRLSTQELRKVAVQRASTSKQQEEALTNPAPQAFVEQAASMDVEYTSEEPSSAMVHGSKAATQRLVGFSEDVGGDPKMSFAIEVQCAELLRSFTRVGRMDPYATVSADGKELMRTPPHKRGHVSPEWNVAHTLAEGSTLQLPESVTVTVCHRNALRREILCGSVDIPVSEDMGWLDVVDFELTKKGRPTGTVCVSIGIRGGYRAQAKSSGAVRQSVVGGELDHVLMSIELASQPCERFGTPHERRTSRKSQLKSARISLRHGSAGVHGNGGGDAPSTEVNGDAVTLTVNVDATDALGDAPLGGAIVSALPAPKSGRCSQMMPAILGFWKCVATQGLDEFLKKSGVGMFQRKIAGAARWPSWDFIAADEAILFVNHSAIGDLKEEIPIGKEYQTKDGHGNALTCFAEWTPSPNGGRLLIARSGSGMSYTEERTVAGDGLEFVLTNSEVGESWGRTFVRG